MNSNKKRCQPGSGRAVIFIVDDNIEQLKTDKNTLGSVYTVHTIPTAGILFKMFEKILPDLIVLDIDMPYMTGVDMLAELKSDSSTKDIPVIIYTRRAEAEFDSLNLGAADFIVKPCDAAVLLKRIELRLPVKNKTV